MAEYDAIIVGGGIVGAACARELTRHGKNVIVLEANDPGCQATSQCMGHIITVDDSEEQLKFSHMSTKLWAEEIKTLPTDCEAVQNGTLWVAEDEEELAEAAKKQEYLNRFGIEAQVIGDRELYRHEKNLRSGLAGGLRVPGDRIVYPANCTKHFLKGITVKRQCRVTAIGDNSVSLADGTFMQAPIIINAAGVNSPELTPGLPVKPRKGHLLITDRYPGFANHQLIELGYIKSAHGNDPESVAFNVQPRPNGQLLIGSSREFVGLDQSLNRRILAKMLDRACHFMPGLRQLKGIRAWTGFRPASEDGYPFIGPHPTVKGLYLATGHEGLGITTSLGTAKVLTALITNQPPPVNPHLFRVERMFDKEFAHAEH